MAESQDGGKRKVKKMKTKTKNPGADFKWKPISITEEALYSLDQDVGFCGLEELDEQDWGKMDEVFQQRAQLIEEATGEQEERPAKKQKKTKMEPQEDGSSAVTLSAHDAKQAEHRDAAKLKRRERLQAKKQKAKEKKQQVKQDKSAKKTQLVKSKPTAASASDVAAPVRRADVSAWKQYALHGDILMALARVGFEHPTPIQQECLPAAIRHRKDVVGAAKTGSGKTLAFGLPIVNYLLNNQTLRAGSAPPQEVEVEQDDEEGATESTAPTQTRKKQASDVVQAVILTPTRELAIQIKDHLAIITQDTPIQVMALVGGMAIPKQRRLLSYKPHIVIATPGRLWELISEGEPHLSTISSSRFLVLDEADRMVEVGHFPEVTNILAAIYKHEVNSENSEKEDEKKPKQKIQRQTFLFSATLMMNPQDRQKGKNQPRKSDDRMNELMQRVRFRGDPEIIDLTNKDRLPSQLEISALECVDEDKDYYLYYFLCRYKGRTVVFVNAISAARRLMGVLAHLDVNAVALHASMQQKQRLKKLDKFKRDENSVLIATDVAARGLDIPLVKYVVHYQMPRTAEIYVHRSGRTARAESSGFSMALVGPKELNFYRQTCQALGMGGGLPQFPVDAMYMGQVKKRVNLARKIDSQMHQVQKKASQKSWFEKYAKELDVIMDDAVVDDENDTQREKQQASARLSSLQAELKKALTEPLLPRGVSKKFLTTALDMSLPSLLDQNKNTDAAEDLRKGKKRLRR
eukprot:GILK01009058.1.p1 GENE.GILK01009058.1~~GILK01009058.1.p1  ORF type:complete len:763 (+),score=169.34 GILK01009058.1:48-2291(+)